MAGPNLKAPHIRVDTFGAWASLDGWRALDSSRADQIFAEGGKKGAEAVKTEVVRLYTEGTPGHAPNHPLTILLKGGDQPLRETGSLADGVEVFMVRKGSGQIDFLVGFGPGMLGRRAALHEDGAVFPMTEGRRRFFAAFGIYIRADTQFIFIPARPIFARALATTQAQAAQIMQDEFDKALTQVTQGRGKTAGNFWTGLGGFLQGLFGRR